MRKLTEKKGITLIALVVTIIILIILAGISIGSLSGEKGIIDNAKLAKNETNKSKVEEQIYLSILEAEQENENASLQNVKDKLKENGVISEDSQVDEKGKITTNEGYEFEGKLDDYLGIEIGDTGNTGEDTQGGEHTGENVNSQELDNLKNELEDLKKEVAEQKEKNSNQEQQIQSQNEQIQSQENKIKEQNTKITNMTTWKTVNINLTFPTTSWTTNEVVVPELIGANRVAFKSDNEYYSLFMDNSHGLARQQLISPYHTAAKYQYWGELTIHFETGLVAARTCEIGTDFTVLPKISHLKYIKY